MRHEIKIERQKSETRRQSVLFCILCSAFCILSSVSMSFSGERVGIKILAVLSGDEIMGRLNQPSGLFFDETKKRLYIADSGNSRLVSFDSEFKYLAELSHEGMTLPLSLIRNREGQFFILDSAKAEIVFVDLEKKTVKPFSFSGVPSAKEKFVPGRMAIDKDSKLYIIDRLNKRLLVVEQTGAFVREITIKDKGFFGFADVKVDDKGEIYAIDAIGGVVYVFDGKGKIISRFGSKDNTQSGFRFPASLAVHENGFIYIADQHAGRILVFDKKGVFQYVISRPGVKEGELSYPSYIFIDKEARIYVIDGNRVQIFQEEKL